jgi:hypothetical protein
VALNKSLFMLVACSSSLVKMHQNQRWTYLCSYIKILGRDYVQHIPPRRQEMNAWGKSELERVANNFLIPKVFRLYVKSKWLPKTGMWVVGYHNLPYA